MISVNDMSFFWSKAALILKQVTGNVRILVVNPKDEEDKRNAGPENDSSGIENARNKTPEHSSSDKSNTAGIAHANEKSTLLSPDQTISIWILLYDFAFDFWEKCT